MIGMIALARDRMTFDFAVERSGDDGCTATDAISHARDGPAVDACLGSASGDGARTMQRAGMTMAYENNGFHKYVLCG